MLGLQGFVEYGINRKFLLSIIKFLNNLKLEHSKFKREQF